MRAPRLLLLFALALLALDRVGVSAHAAQDAEALRERIAKLDAALAVAVEAEEVDRDRLDAVGRALALLAGQHEAAGETALAALRYLDAASLARRTGPAPIDAVEVVYSVPPDEERAAWLFHARRLAIAASGATLPAIAADDPARDLQQSYVGRQLAGSARWLLRAGVQLEGLADVTGFPGEAPRHLVSQDGAPRFIPGAPGAATDLSAFRVDLTVFARMKALRGELVELRADLTAARRAMRADLPALRDQKSEIDLRAIDLQRRVDGDSIDERDAELQLDDLRRQSRALAAAINAYNRRTEYLAERGDAFNAKVGEHNALLAEVNGRLSEGFELVVGPATRAAAEAWLTAAPLSSAEKDARRFLLGLNVPNPQWVQRPAAPATVAAALRYAGDADRAAAVLVAALAEREASPLFPYADRAAHTKSLMPAIDGYLDGYGAEAFATRVLKAGLEGDPVVLVTVGEHLRSRGEVDRLAAIERAMR